MKTPRLIPPLIAPGALALALGMTGAFSHAQAPPAAATSPAQASASAPPPRSYADLSTLLQRGLFEEEGRRRLDEAAAAYEALLAGFDEQKHLAATALFRLAEVRRKQDRQDEAIALYQKLLAEFPEAITLAASSREALAALGVKEPAAKAATAHSKPETPPQETEEQALQRLQSLAAAEPEALLGEKGYAALVEACRNGWLKAGALIFDHGYQPTHIREWHGLLATALQHGHTEMGGLLTERGMNPVLYGSFLTAATAQGSQEVFDFLLEAGADPNATGRLAFHLDGHPPETLLRNPLLLEDDRYPALSIAIATRNSHMIQRLLDAGADPGYPSSETGVRPMHIVALMDDPAMVRLLLDAGASASAHSGSDPDQPHLPLSQRATPLHVAAIFGSLKVIDPLIEAGARLEARDSEGKTPLFDAIVSCEAPFVGGPSNHDFIIWNFLSKKADVTATDNEGRTALDVWTSQRLENDDISPYGFASALGRYLSDGASPEIIPDLNQPGRTLLAIMREKGREWASVVSTLLKHGAIEPGNTKALAEAAAQAPDGHRKAVLSRRVHYDAFDKSQGGIAISVPEAGWFHEEIRRAGDGKAAPSLQEVLFEWNASPVARHSINWSECVIYRHDTPSNAWKRLFTHTYKADTFPILEWGDIIEFTFSRETSRRGQASNKQPRSSYMSHLGESISRRVVIISGEQEYPLILDGKSALYDPTAGKAPLLPVTDLLALLGINVHSSPSQPPKLVIERLASGGKKELAYQLSPEGEWTLAAGQAEPSENTLLYLRDGDRVRFAAPPAVMNRDGCITIVSPGKLLEWKLPVAGDASGPAAGAPTLLQTLAAFYQPHVTADVPIGPGMTAGMWQSQLQRQGTRQRPLLTHPDWARLRVRRLATPGSTEETVIAPPWASMLGAITADTPAAEAAAADLPLQAGDIIEMPVLAEVSAPWEGLGQSMSLLMAKALSLSVTLIEDGLAREHTFSYTPPDASATPAGTILTSYHPQTPGDIRSFTAGAVIGSVFRDPMALLSLDPADKRPLPQGNPEALWRCYLRNGDKLTLRRVGKPIP